MAALEKAKEEKEVHGELETEHPGCLGTIKFVNDAIASMWVHSYS